MNGKVNRKVSILLIAGLVLSLLLVPGQQIARGAVSAETTGVASGTTGTTPVLTSPATPTVPVSTTTAPATTETTAAATTPVPTTETTTAVTTPVPTTANSTTAVATPEPSTTQPAPTTGDTATTPPGTATTPVVTGTTPAPTETTGSPITVTPTVPVTITAVVTGTTPVTTTEVTTTPAITISPTVSATVPVTTTPAITASPVPTTTVPEVTTPAVTVPPTVSATVPVSTTATVSASPTVTATETPAPIKLKPVLLAPSPAAATPPPVITGISPDTGWALTTITITGTGFTDVISVTFSGNDAFDFTIVSDTQITARLPILLFYSGTLDVEVSTRKATAVLPGAFNYGWNLLTITVPPSDISYSGTLNGEVLALTSSFTLTVNDSTWTRPGWNLQASIGTLTSGSNTIPASNHTIQNVSIGRATGTAPVNRINHPLVIPTSNGKIFSSQSGTGTGQTTLTFNTRLLIPAEAAAGTYTTTLTISIVSGP